MLCCECLHEAHHYCYSRNKKEYLHKTLGWLENVLQLRPIAMMPMSEKDGGILMDQCSGLTHNDNSKFTGFCLASGIFGVDSRQSRVIKKIQLQETYFVNIK